MSEVSVHISDLPTSEKVKDAFLKLQILKIRLLYERYFKSGNSAFVTKCRTTHQTSTTNSFYGRTFERVAEILETS